MQKGACILSSWDMQLTFDWWIQVCKDACLTKHISRLGWKSVRNLLVSLNLRNESDMAIALLLRLYIWSSLQLFVSSSVL